MKKLFTLLTMLTLYVGSLWGYEYTITYKADGSYFNTSDVTVSSGWNGKKWKSNVSGKPIVTITSTSNAGFETQYGYLGPTTFTISVPDGCLLKEYTYSQTGVWTDNDATQYITVGGTRQVLTANIEYKHSSINSQTASFIIERTQPCPTITIVVETWKSMSNDASGEWSYVSGGQNLGSIKFTTGNSESQSVASPNLTSWIQNMPVVTDGITLKSGQQYTISWSQNDNLKYTYIRAFLDANMNYSFLDANELLGTVGTEGQENGNNKSGTIVFTVPVVTTKLKTRIRLRVDGAWYNNSHPSNVDPDNNTNRIVYDIPVTILASKITGKGSTGSLNVSDVSKDGWNQLTAGTGWVMALDVESNGASYNQWGSSLFALGNTPFPEKNGYRGIQFYMQSSTNGGHLNAVFNGGDHSIANVEYNENFTTWLTYDGDKSLGIYTEDASGNGDMQNYTLNNALGTFSQLSYGLPEGINIKSLTIETIPLLSDLNTTESRKIKNSKGGQYVTPTLTSTTNIAEAGSFKLYKAGTAIYNSNKYATYYIRETTTDKWICAANNAVLTSAGATKFSTSSAKSDRLAFIIIDDDIIPLASIGTSTQIGWNWYGGASSSNVMGLNDIDDNNSTWQFLDTNTYTVVLKKSDETAAPDGAGLLYGGETYISSFVAPSGLQTGVVTAVAVSGYQSQVTYDEDTHTFTVVYTANRTIQNPSSVVALLNRIGGEGTSDKIETLLDENLYSGTKDAFILSQKNGKPLVKGSSISAITTGIGWYLNHYLNVNIAWNTLNECGTGAYVDLPAMVLPTTDESHTCQADYRYYLNYCTFGYSMTSWSEARWMKEIDWMALHGVNAPLQIIGLEKVWKDFLVNDLADCGGTNYSEADAEAFVPGPAFVAWWGMNNLQGWGGDGIDPAAGMQDDKWYDRQQSLARKICEREIELGMQPVLPGFSGMVPGNFQSKSGLATETANQWCGFQRPAIVDPTGTAFARLAEKYYERLHSVMGCTSKYYSMDPFHEGGTISSGKYAEGYRAVYDAMDANCGCNTEWIIQQWQWANYQGTSLTAVPEGRLVVLDLFSDGSPQFGTWSGYSPQKAIYCTIPNFGGRSGLMGRLQNMTDNYFTYKQNYTTICGIGAAPEAIEQTPVTYDLLFELPWYSSKPDVDDWVKSYATSRYGQENATAQSAWSTLKQTALNYGADAIQGPVEDVWAAIPNLACNAVSAWGKTYNDATASNINTPVKRKYLISAVYELLGEKDVLSGSNYDYDLVEFGGQVLADYAYDLLKAIKAARDAGNTERDTMLQNKFLQLILDVDELKGTNTNFRLGKWTQEARDAAAEVTGASTATPDWYEEANARTIITTWGDYDQSVAGGQARLRDYSYRSWQGLMKDVYYPRWKYYFDNDCTHPGSNDKNWFYFEWNWAHRNVYSPSDTEKSSTKLTSGQTGYRYSPTAEGTAADVLAKILPRYIGTFEYADGTKTYYYKNLEEIDDTYSGIYRITYSGDSYAEPLYIGYNEDLDNAKNKGYKIILNNGASHAAADEYFILSPVAGGYTISAQGMFLKTTASGWEHMMFSKNRVEAGIFIIEETGTAEVYKIHSNGSGKTYLNAYATVIGNDAADKSGLSTFQLTKAETYPLTVSAAGYATLCVPFNITMAEDVAAYDAVETDISGTGETRTLTMKRIAKQDEVLKAGTPVVIKASAGDYDLLISLSGENAKSSIQNSLLKGTYVSTNIVPVDKTAFILSKPSGKEVGFYKMKATGTTIGANKTWLEWAKPSEARSLTFQIDESTGIYSLDEGEQKCNIVIYDLTGRRLSGLQKGINIVNGTKVIK